LIIGVNDNVTPPIYPLVTIENIEDKKLLVIEIEEGISKDKGDLPD